METKIQKFENALPSIFLTQSVEFLKIDNNCFCVRSSKTGMFCGSQLEDLMRLSYKYNFHFYVRSNRLEHGVDCVEFVIYF